MHEHSYCTYIMASRSHTLYIGITSDLHKRVFQHKWREHEGFTARYNCDRLLWFERYQDVQRANQRVRKNSKAGTPLQRKSLSSNRPTQPGPT